MIALRGAIHVACFHHHVYTRRLAMPPIRRGEWGHATSFLRWGCGWGCCAGEEKKD